MKNLYNVPQEENEERISLRKAAKERIIETLKDGYEGELCELHNECFNTDYEYLDEDESRAMLTRYDVFTAIEEVKEYEQFNFGEVNTDFSKPADICNMLWYIIGEEVLDDLMKDNADCDELWNCYLEDNEIKLLIKIFSEKEI